LPEDDSTGDLGGDLRGFMEPPRFLSFDEGKAAQGFSGFGDDQEVYRALGNNGMLQEADVMRGVTNSEGLYGGAAAVSLDNASLAFGELTLNPKQAPLSLNPKHNAAFVPQSVTAVNPRVEPPSPPGGYLEPSHVQSSANPVALIQALLTILRQLGIDCESKQEHFKIRCTGLKGYARLSFNVRVWRMDRDYAVEFQRRSGCAFHFAEVYRQTKESLAADQLLSGAGAVHVSSEARSLPTASPPPLEAVVTVEQLKQSVKALLTMVASPSVDVKVQGIAALADLTASDAQVQKMMVGCGVLEALVRELPVEDEDVQRCAVTGLANLCRDRESACDKVLQAGGVKPLLAMARSKSPQLLRETARLVVIMGSALGSKVQDDEYRRTLKHLMSVSDPRTRDFASQLLEAV